MNELWWWSKRKINNKNVHIEKSVINLYPKHFLPIDCISIRSGISSLLQRIDFHWLFTICVFYDTKSTYVFFIELVRKNCHILDWIIINFWQMIISSHVFIHSFRVKIDTSLVMMMIWLPACCLCLPRL